MQSEFCTWQNFGTSKRGQTLCKIWLTSTERRRCSNEAKTRNPFKFAGVPQTQPTSAISGPKFTILRGHVEETLLFNKFFSQIVDTCLSCEDTARQSCAMVPRWRFCVLYFQRAVCSTSQTCILHSHYGHTMCGSCLLYTSDAADE